MGSHPSRSSTSHTPVVRDMRKERLRASVGWVTIAGAPRVSMKITISRSSPTGRGRLATPRCDPERGVVIATQRRIQG